MKTARELRAIAAEYKPKVECTLENSNFAVDFFTKDLKAYAERGKFERKTTCLVKCFENFKNKYNCQTGTGGEGFTIDNIKEVIAILEGRGFKVEFIIKNGYCPFNISWE